MSFRDEHYEEIFCGEKECAWWDEERGQCCILTQALAAAGKPSVAPVIMQPSVHTTPPITLNSSGDWVNPNPYRVDCEYKYNGEHETTNLAADYIFNGGL